MTDLLSSEGPRIWRLPVSRDPAWKLIPTNSLVPQTGSTVNSLLTRSLRHEGGVRAVHTYIRQPVPTTEHEIPVIEEVCKVFSLGDGVNGLTDTCHGGIVSMMLDETMATFVSQVFGRGNFATTGLAVCFRRKIKTPAIVICRSQLLKPDGTELKGNTRKLELEACIEDEKGQVYATGKAVFAIRNGKL